MRTYYGKPTEDMVEDYYNYDPESDEIIDGDYDDDSSDLPPLSNEDYD